MGVYKYTHTSTHSFTRITRLAELDLDLPGNMSRQTHIHVYVYTHSVCILTHKHPHNYIPLCTHINTHKQPIHQHSRTARFAGKYI